MTNTIAPSPNVGAYVLAEEPGSALTIPAGILGTGIFEPSRVITNQELCASLDTTDEWITGKLGIRERRFIEQDQKTSDMCVIAAQRALDAAGLAASEVDALVLATITPDFPLPSTAMTVAHRLGAPRAFTIDLNQTACSAGAIAILLACHLLQNRQMNKILVVGGDAMSRLTDPADRTTRVIFGDAAAAAVIGEAAPGYGLLAWDYGTLPSDSVGIRGGGSARPTGHSTVEAGDHFVFMDGRVVWRSVMETVPRSISRTAERAGVLLSDIGYFALHQANQRLIEAVMEALSVPMDRAGVTVDRLGNTASASTITALHQGYANQRFGRGDVVMLSGIGAGFQWGSLCFRVG